MQFLVTQQKIRELELIDKQRSKDLNLAEQQEPEQQWQMVWNDQQNGQQIPSVKY